MKLLLVITLFIFGFITKPSQPELGYGSPDPLNYIIFKKMIKDRFFRQQPESYCDISKLFCDISMFIKFGFKNILKSLHI